MPNIKEILKRYYGYDEFREGQENIINSIIDGKDILGIMPTGAGKSICYQIPAIYFSGTTIVISPLISLMKDQVDALNDIGVKATYINSSLSSSQFELVYKNAKEGVFKIIYVAPERLETDSFVKLLNEINISQIAIDEAHCVSQWGHDFRPSYKRISDVIEKLKKRPVISAFTATATEVVKKDIEKLLRLNNPYTFVTSFDRKKLYFSVEKVNDKFKYIHEYIKKHNDSSGIIYCSTRKRVDEVYEFLNSKGYLATCYHAGLSENQRTKNQEEFIFDNKNIMVATNAFGMGIDKSNIRYVIHFNMPSSMENYYQEAGRAGRDNDNSECIILFSRSDIVTNKFLIEQSSKGYVEKTIEYNKLNSMVDYCNTDKCLRKFILEYFGENVEKEKCDNCINCNTKLELVEMTTEAKMILSCIKRMGQKYGSSVVTDVLRGSKGAKMSELKFDTLSTYSIMKDYSKDTVRDMISYLVVEGYLDVYGTKYPLLKLNENSSKILFEDEKIFIKRNIEKDLKGNEVEENINIDRTLFEKLKATRKEISILYNVPPFIIFSDTSLKDMCKYYPRTKDEMLHISGVGIKKYESYGEKFITVIQEYVSENNIDVESIKKEFEEKNKRKEGNEISLELPKKESTYKITYDMYFSGKNVEQIAKERDLTVSTIQGHFMKFLEEKWKNFEKIDEYLYNNQLKREYIDDIKKSCEKNGIKSFGKIKKSLPEEVSYFDIRYIVWKYIKN